LLGMAKTPPNTITTIRSTPAMSYRARITDGLIDDFAVRVPLRAPQLAAAIENNEGRLAEAKRRSVAAAVEVAAAADALERVQTAMTDAFRAFEKGRADAARKSARLATTQETWGRLCADATDRAAALPAVVRRPPPPWWALWLWIVRVIALLANLRR